MADRRTEDTSAEGSGRMVGSSKYVALCGAQQISLGGSGARLDGGARARGGAVGGR